jgi:hypothetical protein
MVCAGVGKNERSEGRDSTLLAKEEACAYCVVYDVPRHPEISADFIDGEELGEVCDRMSSREGTFPDNPRQLDEKGITWVIAHCAVKCEDAALEFELRRPAEAV